MKTHHCKFILLASLLLLAQPETALAQMTSSVTSPAFDAKVYNENAIKQSRKTFANWSLICADVQDLNRRFCNLASLAKAADGNFFVAIVVSTTDDGKPAAVLRMPLSVSLREGVEVASSAAATKKPKPDKTPPRRIDFASCEQQICTSILPLMPADLAALSGRGGLRLRIHVLTPQQPQQVSLMLPSKTLDVVFDGTGFAEALQASQTQ